MTVQKQWCDFCNKEVDFDKEKDFVLRDEELTIKSVRVVVKDAKIAVCPECNHEIRENEYDSLVIERANKEWEKITGREYN